MNHRQPALNLVMVVALGLGLTLALLTLLGGDLVPVTAAAMAREATSDLEISKSDGVDTVDPGDTLTYTIAVTNTGVQTATGVVLTDSLPLSTTFVGSAAHWRQVGSTPVYTHAVGDLEPGAGAYTTTLVITVDTPLPAELEQITNTVEAADDVGAYARDADVNTIAATPQLQISKSDGVESVSPGDTLTYTIAITNNGVQTATGVVLTDTLPLSTTFVGPAAHWQQVGLTRSYTHAVGDLEPGAGAYTTTLVVTVDTPLPADLDHITNTVEVTDESDAYAHDTDVNTVAAAPLPDGVITVCQEGGCDYTIIQDAVDAAEEGDEIRVAAGTYTEVNNRGGLAQIVYLDKSVTLRGGYTTTNWITPDPQANPTTLDAQRAGRVLYVTGDVDPTVVGLRITGGSAKGLGGPFSPPATDAGGGVYFRSSAGALRDSWIFSNTADAGAGLYVGGSSGVALVGNRITDNTAVSLGGGLCLYGTRVSATDNYVAGNRASYGGGMYLRSNWDDALVTDNLITANRADWGGGLYVQLENGTIGGNELSENTAIAGGGGLLVHASPRVSLDANTVSANLAQDGGGLYLFDTDVTIVNTVVADNRARGSGSGIYILQSSPRLLHTTLARNRPYEEPGQDAGINIASGTAALTNTILVAHATGVYAGPGAAVSLDATLWGDGPWANQTNWTGPGTVITGAPERNVWGDPDFVDPDGGDYHIDFDSAAIDRGVSAGVTSDIDGHPRPIPAGGSVDLGADESTGIDLSSSAKSPSSDRVGPGEVITYRVALRNTGPLSAKNVSLVDHLPTHTSYVSGSAQAASGVLTDGSAITWSGTVPSQGSVTLTYAVTLNQEVFVGNTALLTDAYGTRTELTAWVNAYRWYLPLLLRHAP